MAQSDSATSRDSVTLEIDSELLRRARELNIDLSAFLEQRLAAELKPRSSAQAGLHEMLVTKAFDNFEAMMFAPLKVDKHTPPAGVRAVCQAVNDNIDQLVAHAEARRTMPAPDTLEEVRKLNQYLAGRFQALQARMRQDGGKLQTSSKILERNCPDLNPNEARAKQAMNTVLGQYGPEGWCRAMMQKPQSDWSMQEAGNFAQACQGVKLN